MLRARIDSLVAELGEHCLPVADLWHTLGDAHALHASLSSSSFPASAATQQRLADAAQAYSKALACALHVASALSASNAPLQASTPLPVLVTRTTASAYVLALLPFMQSALRAKLRCVRRSDDALDEAPSRSTSPTALRTSQPSAHRTSVSLVAVRQSIPPPPPPVHAFAKSAVVAAVPPPPPSSPPPVIVLAAFDYTRPPALGFGIAHLEEAASTSSPLPGSSSAVRAAVVAAASAAATMAAHAGADASGADALRPLAALLPPPPPKVTVDRALVVGASATSTLPAATDAITAALAEIEASAQSLATTAPGGGSSSAGGSGDTLQVHRVLADARRGTAHRLPAVKVAHGRAARPPVSPLLASPSGTLPALGARSPSALSHLDKLDLALALASPPPATGHSHQNVTATATTGATATSPPARGARRSPASTSSPGVWSTQNDLLVSPPGLQFARTATLRLVTKAEVLKAKASKDEVEEEERVAAAAAASATAAAAAAAASAAAAAANAAASDTTAAPALSSARPEGQEASALMTTTSSTIVPTATAPTSSPPRTRPTAKYSVSVYGTGNAPKTVPPPPPPM